MGGAPVRALSTLLRAQDPRSAYWDHQLPWSQLSHSLLWPHSPARPCPNAWGGAQCLGLRCASLLLAGGACDGLPGPALLLFEVP